MKCFIAILLLANPVASFDLRLARPLQRARTSPTVASVASLVSLAQSAGPVGVDAPADEAAAVEAAAAALEGSGPREPARVPLAGTYELLFSMSKGGSSGKLGPLKGPVSQIIVDDVQFINQVSLLGGALVVQLHATREVLDAKRIRVSFVETVFKLFGKEVVRRPTTGSGVWNNVYVEVGADGSSAGLRVMRTPSLFVLRQRPAAG